MNGDKEDVIKDYLGAASTVMAHASSSEDVVKEVQKGQAAQVAQQARIDGAKTGSTTSVVAPANSIVVTLPTPPAKPEVPVPPADPKK